MCSLTITPRVIKSTCMLKFYKQLTDTSCQYIALQTALSYYDRFTDHKTLKKYLPKNSFGNVITELGMYLEMLGIKTKLISNLANIRNSNHMFFASLEKYKQIGTYTNAAVTEKDIQLSPIIINVDWYKITNTEQGRGAHYVVLLQENEKLWLFDGSNYDKKMQVSFEFMQHASKNINRWHDDGMWLFLG